MSEQAQAHIRTMDAVLLGVSEKGVPQELLLRRANRHGLITGATGTGKTVTLESLAIRLASMGIPVFVPDVKGDLGEVAHVTPTLLWDLHGEEGQDIKVSVEDVGAMLFSRMLELNDTQSGVVTILFTLAARRNLRLWTFEDVREILNIMISDAPNVQREFGLSAQSSIGAIQRKLLNYELNGADSFFGETNFDIKDLLVTFENKGVVHLLKSKKLINDPVLYSTFLFWLLSNLFNNLPEVGDPRKPKLVFFFDEAHLLFKDAPKAFVNQFENVVRLIRSKGVGVYLVTQSPADIPDNILGQLGNRIQHALRAYTSRDQKALKVAADSFRSNPGFDTAEAIQQLKVGEALVSLLDSDGAPGIVERTKIGAVFIDKSAPQQILNAYLHSYRNPAPVQPVSYFQEAAPVEPVVANDRVAAPLPVRPDLRVVETPTGVREPVELPVEVVPFSPRKSAPKKPARWGMIAWIVLLVLAPIAVLTALVAQDFMGMTFEQMQKLDANEFAELIRLKFKN